MNIRNSDAKLFAFMKLFASCPEDGEGAAVNLIAGPVRKLDQMNGTAVWLVGRGGCRIQINGSTPHSRARVSSFWCP